MVKAVRGAVSLGMNTEKELGEKVVALYQEIQSRNEFVSDDVVSIVFSQTTDITFNPARALRVGAGLSDVPLFCTQEPVCEDFKDPLMLRFIITYNSDKPGRGESVYLGRAALLRKDRSKGSIL